MREKHFGQVRVKGLFSRGCLGLGRINLALYETALHLQGEIFKVNIAPLKAEQFANSESQTGNGDHHRSVRFRQFHTVGGGIVTGDRAVAPGE